MSAQSKLYTAIVLVIIAVVFAAIITLFVWADKQRQGTMTETVEAQCRSYMINEQTEAIMCYGMEYPNGVRASCIVLRQSLVGTDGDWWVVGFECH